jgi:hypothetical protein
VRHEMDALVSATARLTDADVEALALQSAEADLMEEIMSTPVLESVPDVEQPRRRWSGGRRLTALAGAAAVAASILFTAQAGRDTGWAAEVLEVAEAAPRLLLDHPDWRMRQVDEFSVDYGVMVFTDGAGQFQLEWMPLAEQPPITDSDRYAAVEESITVVGREAVLRRFDPSPGPRAEADLDPLYDAPAFVTEWDQGGYRVSAWGWVFADQNDYEEVLGALREVDVDDWLSAMPANVVHPDDIEEVVSDILADIPIPAGFDRAGIVQEAGVTAHNELEARVAGAVACAWIDQWITASETGDAAAIQEAATALAGTHDWTILQDMDYPQLRAYADAVANETTLPDGSAVDEVIPAGSVEGDTVLEEQVYVYEWVLGCG